MKQFLIVCGEYPNTLLPRQRLDHRPRWIGYEKKKKEKQNIPE
jgi:hypothetical protein